jgi:hypothetical protein
MKTRNSSGRFKTTPIDWIVNERNCWICISHATGGNGYPTFRNRGIHRFIYEECFGEIPKGRLVRHKCDNRLCINPEHLEIGSGKDNMSDRKRSGTWPSGIVFHPRYKLSFNQIIEISSRYRKGNGKILAREFKVNSSTITRIAQRKIWIIDNYGKEMR